MLGVAEFDNTATPGAMPVRALAARLGTTQVAAIDVKPFVANSTDPTIDTLGPPAPRVYAVLDPTSCGHDTSMPCGIAALDPVTGSLAADPAGELPFQLPIKIPGEVVDMAVIGAPAVAESNTVQGLVKIDPGAACAGPGRSPAWRPATARSTWPISHFSVGNALNPLVGAQHDARRLLGLQPADQRLGHDRDLVGSDQRRAGHPVRLLRGGGHAGDARVHARRHLHAHLPG